jgi:hypothetical protein
MSEWLQLASVRWPLAYEEGRVHGDGPFAIVVPSQQSVLLYATESKRHRAISLIDHEYRLLDLEA